MLTEMKQWRIILVLLSVVVLVLVAHLGSFAVLRGTPKLKRLVQDDADKDFVSSVSPMTHIVSASRRLSTASSRVNNTENPSTVIRQRDCWEVEEFESLSECIQCSDINKRIADISCSETGRQQLVLCISSKKKVFKSCVENSKSQEKNFWVFEAFMLIIAACTGIVVRQRQKKLEEMVHEKLKKQMNSDTV